jgi:hypothetical protein
MGLAHSCEVDHVPTRPLDGVLTFQLAQLDQDRVSKLLGFRVMSVRRKSIWLHSCL